MPRIRPEGGVIGVNNTPTIGTATGVWSMHDVVRNTRNSTWPEDFFSFDPYFDLNALLIHADSSDGKSNQSIVDSSTGARTITTFGNPGQGTFTPFSRTGWSNYFNASGYMTFASNAAFGLGTGDFTIETWVYLIANASSGGTNILDFRTSATAAPWTLNVTNTGSGNFVGAYTSFGVTGVGAQGTALALHTWYHIAVTRTSGTWRIFINGVNQTLTGSGYDGNLGTSNPITVGATVGGGTPLNGYLSDLRIIKGTSLYTASFTPPTSPLTAVAGTSLLICQSNRFRDNSSNGFSTTVVNVPSVESFSPYNPTTEYSTTTVGGSIFFDGVDDYLTVPGSADLTFDANFTIEFFCYIPASISGGAFLTIGNEATGRLIIACNASRQLQIDIFNVATVPFTGGTFQLSTWNHFAYVRVGSTITAYINGVSVGTYSSSATLGNTASFRIARDNGANHTKAYLSGINIVKGTALYTTAFTPPTAPIAADANTKLLLSGINAGIIDQTSKNNLSTIGTAAVSTTQSKFGGSSLFINNGDSNLVTIQHNKLFNFDAGDFTIEFWVYLTQDATYNFVISKGGSATREWGINVGPSTIRFYWSTNGISTGDSIYSVSPASIPLNTWMHIAVVRSGTSLRIFKDGTQVGTTGTFTTMYIGTGLVNIGRFMDFTGIGHSMFGYIDDLRITKGYARYNAAFTVPASPFKNR